MAFRIFLWVPGPAEPGGCAFASAFRAAGGELAGVFCGASRTLSARGGDLAQRFWRSPRSELRRLLRRIAVSAACRQGMTTLEDLVECRSPLENWGLAYHAGDLQRECLEHSIPYQTNVDLDGALPEVVGQRPAAIACFGMGIVPAAALGVEGLLLLNAHMGSVPRYRGMHAIEWALIEGESPSVSVMAMAPGIDTGDIVHHATTDLRGATTLEEVRRRTYALSVDAMVQAAVSLQKGSGARMQQAGEGRTCYRMHPRLRRTVEARLAPSEAPEA